MALKIIHIIRFENEQQNEIIHLLHSILKNQKIMSQDADEIKQALNDAKAKTAKIAADVALLHSKIDALSTAPTPTEIAEIKSLSAELNASLQAVDDSTPEE